MATQLDLNMIFLQNKLLLTIKIVGRNSRLCDMFLLFVKKGNIAWLRLCSGKINAYFCIIEFTEASRKIYQTQARVS